MPDVGFTLNGESIVTAAGVSALESLRTRLGVTGAKLICGVGGCGACVVMVDGIPTETCVLDVSALEGSGVVTVEGIGVPSPTSLQKAMIANDAVQCGFCSPGLVVAAERFVNEWKNKSEAVPEPIEIAAVLDGHLCRCGAYPGIVAAVQAAISGEFDGQPVPSGRPDALAKVSGAAKYTVDVALDHMLIGRIVRSTVPRARVLSIATEKARQIPGVRAVVDLLDEDRMVRYFGQPIAAVAAADASQAEEAAAVVEIAYEELPAAVGMESARAEDAPALIGKRLFLQSNSEASLIGATLPRKGNVRGPMGVLSKRRYTARRRIRSARRSADEGLIDASFRVESQSHAAPEPHAAVAVWNGDSLRVHLSTQSVSSTAERLAKRFGLDTGNVTVLAEHVGGAFGAKQGLPEPVVAAAVLARETGTPVKIVFDPREELAYGGYRPGAEIELSLLVDDEGNLEAISSSGYMDSGDSAGQTVVGLMRVSYPGPPMDLNDYDVISNGAPAKPFQAPGAPIALFALESVVDEQAQRLGLDAILLRRRWNPRGSRRLLYDWVDTHPLWQTRDDQSSGNRVRGVGVAFGTWHYVFDPSTVVTVGVDSAGFYVETSAQEIGTGTTTTLATAVASVFGVEISEIDVRMGDSSSSHGPTSSGSRTTPSVYPTARAAAMDLLEELLNTAMETPGLRGAVAVDGGLRHAGESLPWSEVLPRLGDHRVSASRPRDKKMPLTPVAIEGVKFGRGVSDVAHIIAVEVDVSTGDVAVTEAAVGLVAGRIHTKKQATSQIHGALARGIGQALWEQRLTDPATGVVTTASYDRYRIMRMSEMPEVDVRFFEEGFDHAAGEGAGIAELSITSVPAAVANAIANATGWRPRHLPITSDEVKKGLNA